MSSDEPQPGWASATLRLSLLSQDVEVRVRVPARPCRLVDVLPVVHSLTDLMAADGARACRKNRRRISCRKGCAACCLVAVPVAGAEARYLGDLVARMPAPRRLEILGRFRQAWAALEEAGLLHALFDLCAADQRRQDELLTEYYRLGIPCPFLEEGACSIYPDRPVVCREVLVVSPAENCGGHKERQVERVELAGRLSAALARMGPGADSPGGHWVPLIVAPAWAAGHPDDPPTRPGIEFIKELLDRLTGKGR
jgi:Fe-S-cluster containining protein